MVFYVYVRSKSFHAFIVCVYIFIGISDFRYFTVFRGFRVFRVFRDFMGYQGSEVAYSRAFQKGIYIYTHSAANLRFYESIARW